MTELTAQQTAQLDQVLTDRYQSLRNEVQEEMERTGNIQYVELMGRDPGDIGDESVADAVADLNLEIVDRQVKEMRDIESARRRIKAGSYGICMDCGADIGFDRLMAYPTAKRCLACQQQHDRVYAAEAHPSL
ncbi:DnaK suppressor protein [Sulfuriferula multivorans]|uniref:DnaK suppressor protein n=1 Tax=Sulfuriferula multivorans TaxID=1559896 RepID=A0A401JZQ5_9PROT|nr:TraR/DksA family transcriptional regulator [Sulfuriferula multivorans]GCB02271.1 DnaK suppressor protein [Sulfuriferula multivorans]